MEKGENFLYVDVGLCIGCGNCLSQCPLNDLIDKNIAFGKVDTNKPLFKVVNGLINRPNICFNCVDAPCIKACDKDILKMDESGFVYIDIDININDDLKEVAEKFIICHDCHKKCVDACPSHELVLTAIKCFGRIYTVPIKCDLCGGSPQCSRVCPTGAIQFINIEKEQYLNKKKYAETLAKAFKLIEGENTN